MWPISVLNWSLFGHLPRGPFFTLFAWPKPWKLSLIVLWRSVGGPNCGSFCLIGQNSGSYRSYNPKPWELLLKTNPQSPKPWQLSLKTDPQGPKPWELSLKTNTQRPKPWELSRKTNPQRPSGRSSHGNRSPVAICRSSQKIQKYRVIFPRQNVANFNTKLITFWPIA